ncbi:MAG TPA: hypothetical protein VF844_10110 [Ktedonobacteraceae bacterium]
MNQQVCLVTLDDNLVANILSITLFFASLFISLRAFSLYMQARTPRLLVLGLSMGMIALTAIASYLGDNVTSITFNVKWFQYIAQTISFLFILLSLLRNTDDYQRRIVRWHIIASLLLLLLLVITPVLPADFPNPTFTKTLLSGSRAMICLIVFFYYWITFTTKETRFSFLMGAAFLMISFGYWFAIPKYFGHGFEQVDQVGDIVRTCGLLVLLIAVSQRSNPAKLGQVPLQLENPPYRV